jgi:hypothetical protein
MSSVKGSALRAARAWMKGKLGHDYDAFMEGCPDTLRAVFAEAVILPNGRYPRERLHEVFDAIARHEPARTSTNLDALGAYTAEVDLTGVYKILLKIGSVEATLNVLPTAWGRYFEGGRARLVERKPHDYLYDVLDRELHPLHPPLIDGFIRKTVELAGGRSVQVTDERGETAHHRRFRVRWKD